jgi:hypothetical protein
VRDQVSHPYKTTYTTICTFENTPEDDVLHCRNNRLASLFITFIKLEF